MENKFIIIGLDGASYGLLGKWIDNGKLPNLKKIKDLGFTSSLKSTIPFYSAPAWTSLVTGVNPGRHCVFDFFYLENKDIRTISSVRRRVPAFWEILDKCNKRSVIINVPCTYPPDKFNGKMVTGMMTPSKKSEFTHPQSLKEKIKNYKLDSWWQALPFLVGNNNPKKILKITKEIINERFNTLIELTTDGEWDIAFLVVRILDHLQHYLWDNKEVLYEAYKYVDDCLGKLMQKYPDVNYIILSDHGFRSAEKCFYINNFLHNRGYIKFKKNLQIKSMILKEVFNSIANVCVRFVSLFIDVNKISRNTVFKNIMNACTFTTATIFKTSRAFSTSSSSCGVFLDDKTIRDEIIRSLEELKDPDTGRKVIKEVYKREEVYRGEHIGEAPDIIYIVNDEYTMTDRLVAVGAGIKDVFNSEYKLREIYTCREFGHTGEHADTGIFLSCGPVIKNADMEENSICDIFSTIIYGLNIGRLETSDGKIIDMFNKTLNDQLLVLSSMVNNKKCEIGKKEENILKDRLRELGYLG